LYAAGEVACTGVHGANRLASNSLLEGLVFGARAAHAMRQPPAAGGMANVRIVVGRAGHVRRSDGDRDASHSQVDTAVRSLMWNAVGLIRHRDTLASAVDQLADWSGRSDLALVAHLIARAALRRQESRGCHFREDFPARDDLHWKIHVADQPDG
jgi:L-aspartate oxidase